MTQPEKDKLKESIAYANDALANGLIAEEAIGQLYRMIAYYEEKLKEDEVSNSGT